MLTVPLTDGRYDSPPGRPSWLAQQLPSLCFYSRALLIVAQAARMARQQIYTDGDWAHSSFAILRALESCGCRFQLQGLQHVQSSQQPCVFIANHMSTLETFVLPCLIAPYRRVTFVVKQSLIDYPVFGHVMRSRNPIVVQRDNPREDLKTVLEQGSERLAAGISVVVFPQTTRTTGFDAAQFNSIGIKLAQKAGVPVIPVALRTDAWGNGHWIKDFGPIQPHRPIHFHFGAPLTVASPAQARQTQADCVAFISEQLQLWQPQG
ncbi:lysophospholipid acyltransferase family protein [Desulfuromonas thiophila]|jgi:1-acyl-sn-glycerol-3-phosphate acyltransferase|uniref:1-acyl-sn-glycerol-3-phosphate acyltransferase n=1 Tax=Desulfuromonas thiophila TaxID=57664 RepID=A0A1G7CNJ3_9BACT|nr:lysophospholipid acyltransferase family protein [Desulfuromonas thiophila]MCK9172226.1 1-acyl-sn-glycerol-3-phosphate acyltransferase [Desulfuromonas thiophila]MDY0397864.1 lysophospholipid acyltransferase family protein [Desulfuromonas thiophila]SDE40907.1 1-acyl-sn-glycerol-3-phosphate acyltransferase [Desulfuromonas thiophila]